MPGNRVFLEKKLERVGQKLHEAVALEEIAQQWNCRDNRDGGAVGAQPSLYERADLSFGHDAKPREGHHDHRGDKREQKQEQDMPYDAPNGSLRRACRYFA